MSIARGRINMARPIMLLKKVTGPVMEELQKGSPIALAPYPVNLEPPYRSLISHQDLGAATEQPPYEPDLDLPDPRGRIRLRIWISPELDTRWERAEAFPRQLRGVLHRVMFEVLGNDQGATMWLSCHYEDVAVVQTAFESTYRDCRLISARDDPFCFIAEDAWTRLVFFDLCAPAVYSKRFTEPEGLSVTPLAAVLHAVSRIRSPAVGLYQVVFQPTAHHHDWHRNIASLCDYEYLIRSPQGMNPLLRSGQQLPGVDERKLADKLDLRANPDMGMHVVAVRIGVIGGGIERRIQLRSLDVFSGLIQQGGRPLERSTEADYQFLSPPQLRDMFCRGLTYRPGFISHSLELTSLVHLPPPDLVKCPKRQTILLERLHAGIDLSKGSCIGDCDDADTLSPICIPLPDRYLSLHAVGKPGKGKTEMLKHLILGDVGRGCGVIVLDPHGDMVRDLMDRIPPEHAGRVILLDWSDPELIPIFSPLADVPPASRGRVADNIVSSLKGLSEGWGHRAEHILKSLLHGLLYLQQPSLLDAYYALDAKEEPGKTIRERVLGLVDDPLLKKFWKTDLLKYSTGDRMPVVHKLGLLLDTPPVSRTFMQTQSAINLMRAMEERKVILMNLSGIGNDIQSTLGSLMLSLLEVETVGRAGQDPGQRQPFYVHVDEAHRFRTDALEAILAQCRKYNVGICLCHQYLRQYTPDQVDALATAGTTIIFNVDANDARRLCQSLQDKVTVEDIVSLQKYEAIVRIDTEIVRVRTRPLPKPQHASCRQEIIDRSHQLYYKPAREVLKEINRTDRFGDSSFAPLDSGISKKGATVRLEYEEL